MIDHNNTLNYGRYSIYPLLAWLLFLNLTLNFSQLSLSKSLTFSTQQINFQNTKYDITILKPPYTGLRLYWRNARGAPYITFTNLIEQLKTKNIKVHFAMNAGIFSPGYIPLGLHVENGSLKRRLNLKSGRGNFYTMPNGVFYILKTGKAGISSARKFNQAIKQLRLATQSGPLLVINKKLHYLFRKNSKSKYIRNGVGITKQGDIIFAISHTPVNFYQFAQLFKTRLKCHNALYLDGAISSTYNPSLNRHYLGGLYAGILTIVEQMNSNQAH